MPQPGERTQDSAVTEKTWRVRLKELSEVQAPLQIGLALFTVFMLAGHLLGDPAQPLLGRVFAGLVEIVAILSVLLFYTEEDLD